MGIDGPMRNGQMNMNWYNNPYLATVVVYRIVVGILVLVILVFVAIYLWEQIKLLKKDQRRK